MTEEIITLRMARKAARLPVMSVARWVGCRENTVYAYESGTCKPSPGALALLHEVLDFDYVTLADVPPPPLSHYRQHIQARGVEADDNGEHYTIDSRLLIDWQQIDAGLARWNEMRA